MVIVLIEEGAGIMVTHCRFIYATLKIEKGLLE